MNFASAMIAEEMIHLGQSLGNILAARPEYDVEPLAGMCVVQPQAEFGSSGLPGFSSDRKTANKKRQGQ